MTEIEQGYDATIDDFTNDLMTRDWIAECRELIDERVAPLDDRYRAASIDDGGQALGTFFRIHGKGCQLGAAPPAGGDSRVPDGSANRSTVRVGLTATRLAFRKAPRSSFGHGQESAPR